MIVALGAALLVAGGAMIALSGGDGLHCTPGQGTQSQVVDFFAGTRFGGPATNSPDDALAGWITASGSDEQGVTPDAFHAFPAPPHVESQGGRRFHLVADGRVAGIFDLFVHRGKWRVLTHELCYDLPD